VRHEDLKPNNILITPENEIVIVDWGLGDTKYNHNIKPSRMVDGPSGDRIPYPASETSWSTTNQRLQFQDKWGVYDLKKLLNWNASNMKTPTERALHKRLTGE
jgi:serine/threonine protein kinase